MRHQTEALNPSREPVLPERLGDRRLQVHHGSRDAQGRVTLIPDAVHILDRVTRQSVDKDTGGVGFGHVLDLVRGQKVNSVCVLKIHCERNHSVLKSVVFKSSRTAVNDYSNYRRTRNRTSMISPRQQTLVKTEQPPSDTQATVPDTKGEE